MTYKLTKDLLALAYAQKFRKLWLQSKHQGLCNKYRPWLTPQESNRNNSAISNSWSRPMCSNFPRKIQILTKQLLYGRESNYVAEIYAWTSFLYH
jgi:hypothetical protein